MKSNSTGVRSAGPTAPGAISEPFLLFCPRRHVHRYPLRLITYRDELLQITHNWTACATLRGTIPEQRVMSLRSALYLHLYCRRRILPMPAPQPDGNNPSPQSRVLQLMSFISCSRSAARLFTLITVLSSTCYPENSPSLRVLCRIASPAGNVSMTAFEANDERSLLLYAIDVGPLRIVEPSPLAMMAAPSEWIHGNRLSIRDTSADETYFLPVGKTSHARNRFNGSLITFLASGSMTRRITVEFRVFNDGVAFRTTLVAPAVGDTIRIAREDVEFRFPPSATVTAAWLGANTHFEGTYRSWTGLDSVPRGVRFPLPLLIRPAPGVVSAICEAGLLDYAGMSVQMSGDTPSWFVSDLTRRRDDSTVAVVARGTVVTPWRVVLTGLREVDLIGSDILTHLAPPCELPATTWIRPGKTTWDWWNGHLLNSERDSGKMDFRTACSYINFCAENGVAYHSLTGYDSGNGNMTAWYGDHRSFSPAPDIRITTPIAELHFPALLAYARTKGVGLRLWLHFDSLRRESLDSVFALYAEWGIKGFMLDFIQRDDQEAIAYLTEVMRSAARHHLTVSLHGAAKPTGLTRTFPNLMNHEGVLNLEWDKWSTRCTPDHNVTVPFIRMLAGPMDYHLGGVRSVREADFTPRYCAPAVMGTRAHNAAMYVVFENPMPMLADFPGAYAHDQIFPLIRDIPTTWDETRGIDGAVGAFVAVARRKGADWYIGVMNGRGPRILDVPLTFLDRAPYAATLFRDRSDSGDMGAILEKSEMTASTHMVLHLAETGGALIRLTKQTEK